jgi:hypothetical protein
VEDLESHLGPTKACIDNLCDRAPDGEIMLTGGKDECGKPRRGPNALEQSND